MTDLPPVTTWYTDRGIAIAIRKPDDDVATVAVLPIDYTLSVFIPALLAAINGHATHRDLIDAVDAAIADGSFDDIPPTLGA
jgi:hypothetical protein